MIKTNNPHAIGNERNLITANHVIRNYMMFRLMRRLRHVRTYGVIVLRNYWKSIKCYKQSLCIVRMILKTLQYVNGFYFSANI
jgi:hypothetical protein